MRRLGVSSWKLSASCSDTKSFSPTACNSRVPIVSESHFEFELKLMSYFFYLSLKPVRCLIVLRDACIDPRSLMLGTAHSPWRDAGENWPPTSNANQWATGVTLTCITKSVFVTGAQSPNTGDRNAYLGVPGKISTFRFYKIWFKVITYSYYHYYF